MTRHFKCCVPGCDSRGSQGDISFHKFPLDDDNWMVRCVHPDGRVDRFRRRQIWEDRLIRGQTASASYRVCSLHFEACDFLPTTQARARKWNHLKKTALPSRNLAPPEAEDDGSSELGGKVLETELPDGTVCEFFTFETDKEETAGKVPARSPDGSKFESYSDDGGDDPGVTYADGNHNAAVAFRKRKAWEDPLAQLDGLNSLRKIREPAKRLRKAVDIFDFECVIEALEKNMVRLPSPSWSYSLLNCSVLIFLCWDDDLRLTKKAVLRKGSSLELFCDDRLLITRAELPVSKYSELELALHYLDQYEWCSGADPDERPEECELYTLSGKPRCAPCDSIVAAVESCSLVDDTFDGEITGIL